MNTVFQTAPIGAGAWLRIFAIAAGISLIVGAEKRWLTRRRAVAHPEPVGHHHDRPVTVVQRAHGDAAQNDLPGGGLPAGTDHDNRGTVIGGGADQGVGDRAVVKTAAPADADAWPLAVPAVGVGGLGVVGHRDRNEAPLRKHLRGGGQRGAGAGRAVPGRSTFLDVVVFMPEQHRSAGPTIGWLKGVTAIAEHLQPR